MKEKVKLSKKLQIFINSRAGKITAIILIVIGVLVILSAIAIPIYNRYHNEAMIKKIRDGSYAKTQTLATEAPVATEAAVTGEAVETSGSGLDESQNNQVNKEQQANQILQAQDVIGIVEVEKLDVEYAIVEGSENANIRGAVGHLTNSAMIGAQGNCVIAGHRGGYYGEFFQNLDQMELGDIIKLTDINGKEYLYSVYEKKVIQPWDWSVTENLADKRTVTLLTCEDKGTKRLSVSGILFSQD